MRRETDRSLRDVARPPGRGLHYRSPAKPDEQTEESGDHEAHRPMRGRVAVMSRTPCAARYAGKVEAVGSQRPVLVGQHGGHGDAGRDPARRRAWSRIRSLARRERSR